MKTMCQSFKALIADERGATAVEYGLIAGLIVIGLLGGLTAVGDANDATYEMLDERIAV
ncbi:MAG: Flp family type IVb pilin [Hyphomonas sp.]